MKKSIINIPARSVMAVQDKVNIVLAIVAAICIAFTLLN